MKYLLYLLLVSSSIISANNNEKLLQVYENKFQEYINTTPHKVTDASKRWIDTALSMIKEKFSIFEIGSGFGRDALYMQLCGYKNVQTSDATHNFVKVLRKKGFAAKEFNAIKDSFSKSYNMIFASSVFLHFTRNELANVLKKIHSALTKNGILAFSVKKGDGEEWINIKIGESRYYCYWQLESLKKLLVKSGFEVIYTDEGDKKIYMIARKVK